LCLFLTHKIKLYGFLFNQLVNMQTELVFNYTHFNYKINYKDPNNSCVSFVNKVTNLSLIEDTDCLEFRSEHLQDTNVFGFEGYNPSHVSSIVTKFHLFNNCVIVILSEPMDRGHRVTAVKCSVLSKEEFYKYFRNFGFGNKCELKYSKNKQALYNQVLGMYDNNTDDSFERFLQLTK
jgi:hypothetical protein